ncbi:peptide-methionine (S)-S-oxide reductase MsrA [Pedobacter lithocola]|uniref:Peptide methionine sulfoxide reductase MsrA n=1 Tax=Pedobacter lithocola TaxID=1908239 RepID=A0ABV8PFT1_9SPHI
MQTAIFGGGCFWCTEAVFQSLQGVEKVVSGYMGGALKHPTYMEISNGDTGHAEVIQIDFDETQISFTELLLIFFKTHNPTLLNRQDSDRGIQYRSVVFYDTQEQKRETEKMITELTRDDIFDRPIITEISPVSEFYDAEDYHQNYFTKNHEKPYCSFVIQPKLDKFVREFQDKIKPELLSD